MNNGVVQRVLQRVAGRSVVVLGDLMLDEWVIGDASRISPEAPVPVVHFSRRITAPGGAANVAMNLHSLGARVHMIGVIGDDQSGRELLHELQGAGINTEGVITDGTRCTTQKTRIMAQRQQMVRVDRETDAPLSADIQEQIKNALETQLQSAEILSISDYDKGLAASGVVHWAIAHAAAHGKLTTTGPKPQSIEAFRGATFASLNETEASLAAGGRFADDEQLRAAGEELQTSLQLQALTITLGARGAMLFEAGKAPCHIPAHEVEVFDVAGAGDTFLAAATLAILAGESFADACIAGNLAAAASVRHIGVVAVQADDLVGM